MQMECQDKKAPEKAIIYKAITFLKPSLDVSVME
jgi:hypothetical protein